MENQQSHQRRSYRRFTGIFQTENNRRINQKWRWNTSIGMEVLLKRLAKLPLGSSERMVSAATANLRKLMSSEGFLSSDQSHSRALDDTLDRLEEFKTDLRRGEFG